MVNKKELIKSEIITVLKELVKFSFAVVMAWIVGLLIVYFLVSVLRYNAEVSIVSAMIITILMNIYSLEKLCFVDKIVQCSKKIGETFSENGAN